METVIVRGGKPLYGTVTADGSKNAVLPLLFATLLTDGVSVFRGVPKIGDVEVSLRILSAFGAESEWIAPGVLRIDASNVREALPNASDVSSLRAATYLIGATYARFGRAKLMPYGGCAFCSRPIDLHLLACRAFGGRLTDDGEIRGVLRPGYVNFPAVSVGATVNALFMAALSPGESFIRRPAREPHVMSLVRYLRLAGATVSVTSEGMLVRGEKLHGAEMTVIPDMIEAGTYLLAGLTTGGEVTVKTDVSHFSAFFTTLFRMGADLRIGEGEVTAVGGKPLSFGSLKTAPYPGFPTDLHPPTVPLFAVNAGGDVSETVFPSRFGYLSALSEFGVRYAGEEPSFRIYPSKLHPAEVTAPDLRGGVAAVLTALAAEGESRIRGAKLIHRGYAGLTSKLRSLGADVTEE